MYQLITITHCKVGCYCQIRNYKFDPSELSLSVVNNSVSVAVCGQTTTFVYDGDGNLVKKVKPDGSKTLYVGGVYEVDKTSGGSVTRTVTYYPAAGAMRIDSTLYYVLKDHLGSASVVTNTSGATIGEQRYYPFGETRLTTGTIYTDKLFTGQREMAGLGIYHFNARFYSPKLGRFLSLDSIVPGYANPQNLNRFSYVTNNPLRYIDPTGYRPCEEYQGQCLSENQMTQIWQSQGGSGGGGGGGSGGSGGGSGGGGDYCSTHPGACGAPLPNPSPDLGSGGCVPPPGQWICDIGSLYDSLTEDSSHSYTVSNVVCPASWNCTQEEMIYYLSLFAYPGQNPFDGPAVPGVDYSVSPPFGWFPEGSGAYNMGLIQVSRPPEYGGLVSINTTMESHIFCCGTVKRTLKQDASGAWTVTTVGSGSNSNALTGAANQALGPGLFVVADTQMLFYIMDQKFPNPYPNWQTR